MFSYDPEKRLSIEEIRQHPWMKESDALSQIKIREQILERLDNARMVATCDTDNSSREE